jgi:hypothetical protein
LIAIKFALNEKWIPLIEDENFPLKCDLKKIDFSETYLEVPIYLKYYD